MKEVVILYASETGTAEDTAYTFYTNLMRNVTMTANNALHVNIHSLHNFDINLLPSVDIAIFIVSTTGDGDVPSTMKAFWSFLLRKSLPKGCLSKLHMSVFGLGDSNYEKYNAAARMLSTRLIQLGAVPLVAIGLGDDQARHGYIAEFDRWSRNLFQELITRGILQVASESMTDLNAVSHSKYIIQSNSGPIASSTPPAISLSYRKFCSEYANSHGVLVGDEGVHSTIVRDNDRLTRSSWGQDVRLINLQSFGDVALGYGAGDVAVVFPKNDPKFVQRALKLIPNSDTITTSSAAQTTIDIEVASDAMQKIDISNTHISIRFRDPTTHHRSSLIGELICTIEELLSQYLDIMGIPRRSFFRLISAFAIVDEEREKLQELASAEGTDLYFDYVVRAKRNYIEVLEDFRSCRPPLELWLEAIPALAPRKYSIASSGRLNPHQLQLCVAVSSTRLIHGRTRVGVCSGYLSRISPGDSVLMYFEKGAISKVAKVETNPFLLIGPGTGIAPVRSLAHDRILMAVLKFTHFLETTATSLGFDLTVVATEQVSSSVRTDVGLALTRASRLFSMVSSAPASQQRNELIFEAHRLIQEFAPIRVFFGCRRTDADNLFAEDWFDVHRACWELNRLLVSWCNCVDCELSVPAIENSFVIQDVVSEFTSDVEAWPKCGWLHYSVAFSQDQPQKIYVTDKLLEYRAEIWRAIKAGAVIVVCGAAKSMPKDVRNTIKMIIANNLAREIIKDQAAAGGVSYPMPPSTDSIATTQAVHRISDAEIEVIKSRSNEQAERILQELARDKRYVVEAW